MDEPNGLASRSCHLKPGAGTFDHDPGLGIPQSDRHVSTNVSLLQSSTCDAALDRHILAHPPLPHLLPPFSLPDVEFPIRSTHHSQSHTLYLLNFPLHALVPNAPVACCLSPVGETASLPHFRWAGKPE